MGKTKDGKENAKATEAASSEGKTFGLQRDASSETTTHADVSSQKAKLVEAFDDFLDAIVDQTDCDDDPEPDTGGGTVPSGGGEAPSGGGAAPSGGEEPSGGGEVPSGGGSGTGGGGSETIGGGGPQTEAAVREAFERSKPILREAFVLDQQRETLVNARRAERAQRRASEAALGSISSHQPDSNIAPIVEERSFPPNFGDGGKPGGVTREKFADNTKLKVANTAETGVANIGPPLSAWFGSHGSAIERAQARVRMIVGQQHESSRINEVIQGSDDRVRVSNTTAYPWRCIASLLITASTGAQYVGTGWLVSPRLLLTAGHCVFMSDEGGWVRQIEVIPGRDANNRPYGSAVCNAFRSVTGWTRDENSEYDYGAILLPGDKRFGDQLGWFGYSAASDERLGTLTANLSGYPGDGGVTGIQGTQWFHSQPVLSHTERQITYMVDTVGGQSGAPVWELQQNGGRYGVAIHTHGTSTHNGGTRITREVFDNIVRWAGEVP